MAPSLRNFFNWYIRGWSPTGSTRHWANNSPIVPASCDNDDGEIGGMIGRGKRSTRRKSAPVPLCLPQTPHAARTRTRAAAVGNQRLIFFLIGIVRGGVQLGPLGTAATNRPIVPAPGYNDDGEIGGMTVGRGNRNTRRKSAPVPLCPPQTPHDDRTRTRAAAV
jgi:hypothetical protein